MVEAILTLNEKSRFLKQKHYKNVVRIKVMLNYFMLKTLIITKHVDMLLIIIKHVDMLFEMQMRYKKCRFKSVEN